MQSIYVTLTDAWPQIKDADLLLWRGTGWISSFGRGVHYHASTLAWWGTDLMVVDTHWRRGGDVRLLANDVQQHSGRLDWFSINPLVTDYDREGVIRYMRRLVDTHYGFYSVTKAFLRHAVLLRRFVTPEINDDAHSTYPPFCSEARSRADRIGGGHDPVPFAGDSGTEPADLARSTLYQYRGTLVWDDVALEKMRLPEPKRMFSFVSMAS